ncbi:MAG: Eco57I restriction-modification methylase domain-containing protein, partial [Dissulfuribacterales bacterium]
MNKQQAQQIIQVTFENPFDKGRFAGFVKNLLNYIEDAPFTYQGNYIPEKFRQYIKSLERIGKFSDGEKSLDILIITLQKETSLERARTMQRNFIAWYLNGSRGGEMKDAALVAYVSPDHADWRFSLVKMDYKFEKTRTGKIKVKEEFTPARRWSFLVGANEKSHTAQSRLVNILADDEQAPNLAELENAFDIETVTKEFFLKYRELFLRTKEALDKVVRKDPKIKANFEAKGVDTVNFAKKLLGQIVFLYFLQKKGWFGVGRDDDWGTGSKHFLRSLFDKKHSDYHNFFNDILEPLFYEALRIDRSHDDGYYSRFNCKIPFLNGGLFDPIGNYDWVHTDIHLPDDLFSNSRKTKEGDEGDGILDVFDRYNFTVREDEPLEKEVAIDPELLGKAYEKFNAIRPDNFDEFTKALKSGRKGEENKFNKKFGVYYTPREIVHYMCKQSLINYLYTLAEDAGLADTIKKQDIEDLIEVGELITEHEATALIKQEKIKNGIQKSTEYTALLSDSIRENAAAIDNWLAEITVCDPAVGSGAFPVGMMNEIVRARNVLSVFLNDRQRSDYAFKRRCIEHSLYGVDIDPGAVEIAKLRLWLSLVVDEEDIKNIKPLPNLDYKIVCGNSLLGVEKNLFNHQLFNDLEKLKPLFFKETNPTKKQDYKKQIDDLISQITKGYTEFDFEVYFSEVFHRKGGFDVVIANPPYVDSENMTKNTPELRRVIKSSYSLTRGNWDIYIAFYEKGFRLLGHGGVLSFITPDKWISKSFGDELRLRKTDNLYSIMKAGRDVFEEVNVDAIVSLFTNHADSQIRIYEYTGKTIERKRIIEKGILKEPYTYDWFFSDYIDILKKIDTSKDLLSTIGICENACATSDAYKLKSLIEEQPSHDYHGEYFRIINTGTIGKYAPKWGQREMVYLGERYLCPVVNRKRFDAEFRNTYGEKAAKRKIIIKGLNLLDACLDEEGIFIPGKTTLLITCDDL